MTDDLAALQPLMAQAIAVAQRAYAPYSQYHVGAVLRATDGTLYQGTNIENAAYPCGICAERAAISTAVTEGAQAFDLVIIASRDGGSPCGMCRQVLYEFGGPVMRVIGVNFDGAVAYDETLGAMLLHGFGPENLLT